MLFNSLIFLVFTFILFFLYWFVFNKNSSTQNILLLLASYFFYGWWDFRLMFLLIALTCFTYIIGIQLYKANNDKKRRIIFYFHIFVNILVLCVFKYYNFFIDSISANKSPILKDNVQLIFPLGLSFYTFTNLSYIIEVYKNRINPTYNIVNYNLYVAFFPKIISGPIERPGRFLDQVSKKRSLTYEGGIKALELIVLGYFKKVVVADAISPFAAIIFKSPHDYSFLTLSGGTVLYAFQIYADFSGYSDIAKGVSSLFGIEIMANFNFPFFSQNVSEFWRRWHISLSSWFNDYVFNPMVASLRDWGKYAVIFSIIFTFVLIGVWHGSEWKYIIFGLLQGVAIVFEFIFKKQRKKLFKQFLGWLSIITGTVITVIYFSFSCIFLNSGIDFVINLFSINSQHHKNLVSSNTEIIQMAKGVFGILLLMIIDYALYKGKKLPTLVYYFLFCIIIILGSYSNVLNFIYFKF